MHRVPCSEFHACLPDSASDPSAYTSPYLRNMLEAIKGNLIMVFGTYIPWLRTVGNYVTLVFCPLSSQMPTAPENDWTPVSPHMGGIHKLY